MTAVTTQIVDSVNIRISWAKPYENSETIDAYKILILQTNGVYSELMDHCNGSNDVIILQKYCDIPMLNLRALPYSLSQNALVVAKASAKNIFGWAQFSVPNVDGARI